jgi:uncharacterized cupin superfamily protein
MSVTTGKIPAAIAAADAPLRSKRSNLPSVFHEKLSRREKRVLGDLFGLTVFGVNLTRLGPGGISSLRHVHTTQDEFVYILEGEPTLVTDNGEFPLRPGMCAGFKAGNGEAHHLVNRINGDVVYLEIGDRSEGDRVTYADDDLMAVEGTHGKRIFTRKDGTPY